MLKKAIISIVALTIAFLVGKYTTKPVEKIVVQTIEVEKETASRTNKDVITVVEETTHPDCKTPVKKTTIVDKSQIETLEKLKSTEKNLVKETSRPQWLIGGGMGYNTGDRNQVYSVEANTRILNLPAYIGLQGTIGGGQSVGLLKILVEF